MQTGHQQQIACDVDQTRHKYEQQRRTAVPQPAEHCGQQVVRHDEHNAAAADPHIACRERNGLLRCLHQHRDRTGKEHEQHKQSGGKDGKHNTCPAEHRADLLFPFFTDIPRDQHGYAHRKLCDNKCDQIEHLTAG